MGAFNTGDEKSKINLQVRSNFGYSTFDFWQAN